MLNGTIPTFPILNTSRLTLRQLAITDDQEIFTLRSDSDINKYLDRQICNTIDDARNFITKINEYVKNGDSLYWAITLKEKDKLLGTICLYGFSNESDTCEIGYELLTNFQSQGIMKEALVKVIDYACKVIKTKKIEAFLHRDNQNSIKLLEKCSFKKSNEPNQANPEIICYHFTIL